MTITITLDPSGPTKRQVIELAFSKITMPGYELGKTAEEIAEAMGQLSALMYEWPYSSLGFAQPDYGTGSAEESSGLSFEVLNGVAAALALRLAAFHGRTLPAETRGDLASSVSLIRANAASIPTMPMGSRQPRGAGARGRSRFISELSEDVNAEDV